MKESGGNEETLPPGFRFHPTDEELITCYLMNKISDSSFTGRAITDIDLNKSEPWELPGKAKMGEKEWYFFNMRDRKYPTGVRTNRATKTGYWKTTGKDREIFNSTELVGMKKTLVFYKGRAPRGEKSNWVMHEYRIHSNVQQDEWVVCRIFKKSGSGKKYPCNSNNTRPPFNPYSNSMQEIAPPNHMMPSMVGWNNNYLNSTTTAEVLRGGTNLPIMQYSPALSGLNLNLGSTTGGGGGGGATTTTQPLLKPMQHSNAIAEVNMNMMTADQNININNNSVGNYGAEIMSNNRYMGMEHCMDLDTYWLNNSY